MVRLSLASVVTAALVFAGPAAAMHDATGRPPLARGVQARTATQLPVRPTFVLKGHGWGHGIGLGQYGAYGYALHGWSYKRILAHYYSGTTVGQAPLSRVRVLLAQGRKTLVVSSAAAIKLTDGSGQTRRLPAGEYKIGPGLKLKLAPQKQPQSLPSPLVFAPAGAPLELGGRPYRGTLQIAATSGKLQAVNTVGIDAYVQGVVPREMPYRWAAEALKAQAVAARSYALSHLSSGGSFDLYPDTRSQVYGGISAEQPSTNDAVAATGGEVVLYAGEVADTLFFSTSGGKTANIEDVWPRADPAPYLVSVPDPYDTLSPYHDWGPFGVAAATLKRRLHVPGSVLDAETTLNPSGRVDTLIVHGSRGDVSVSGQDARRLLGLRSTWFRVGVLSQLVPPTAPVVYGSRARLTGIAHDVSPVVVQVRPVGTAAWTDAATATPAADGSVLVATQPKVTTDYRLSSGVVAGVGVRVRVAPLVRFYPVKDKTSLSGYARPVLTGVPVQIQRLDASTWATVAQATIDDKGDFQANLSLTPGTYRARVAPGRGLVPGTTPVLKVVSA